MSSFWDLLCDFRRPLVPVSHPPVSPSQCKPNTFPPHPATSSPPLFRGGYTVSNSSYAGLVSNLVNISGSGIAISHDLALRSAKFR